MEVLLVNTCATPLKLDGLQLQVQVQPQQPTATQQQPGSTGAAAAGSAGADGSSSSAVTAQQQQHQAQAQRSVSVMLAAGSKPVRVLLTHVPSKAGYVAITGVQVGVQGLVRSGFMWDLLLVGHTKTQPPAVILPAAVKRWLVLDLCLLSCEMVCHTHPAAAKATGSKSDTRLAQTPQKILRCLRMVRRAGHVQGRQLVPTVCAAAAGWPGVHWGRCGSGCCCGGCCRGSGPIQAPGLLHCAGAATPAAAQGGSSDTAEASGCS